MFSMTNVPEKIVIAFDAMDNIQVSPYTCNCRVRLEWQAPGLDIYVRGSLSVHNRYERAANMAMNEAMARHIPAIALRRVSQ